MLPVIAFDLPLPPSANACWAMSNGRVGRSRTPVYKAWMLEASLVASMRWKALGKPVIGKGYTVIARVGMDRRSDLDNRLKPILDMLVKAAIVPDDRWIDRIEMDREGPMGRVIVTVIGGAL